jgi:dTDP-4-amino-4,6-dideoxygalactose transaminase
MMNIQMVDLKTQYERLKPEIDAGMQAVINSSSFINGPALKAFQGNLEKYLGVKHVIPCANGTDALQVALMALGLKPGDEVITSTFTFIATVEVIGLLGLKPVLVDVDEDTFTLIPDQVRAAIGPLTRAIIPVHLYGQGAPMEEILSIAEEHQLYVVEDAAQSLGAEYYLQGKWQKLGTLGHIGCTSFFPSKSLGCFGDGGACFTNDVNLAKQLRTIINHGAQIKYYHERIGVNSRLDTLQAAVLDVKLSHLDDFNRRRRQAAAYYDKAFESLAQVQVPARNEVSQHIFHQYVLRVKNGLRDELKDWLQQKSIPSMVYYPVPLHRQKAFEPWVGDGMELPHSEQLCQDVLALPMHTEMTEEQLQYICDGVITFFKGQ